jgi:hypothetical protein
MQTTLKARLRTETLTQRSERLEQLKRDIAAGEYDVNATQVADAIVLKLRLVKRGLEALSTSPEADRIRADQLAHRRAT